MVEANLASSFFNASQDANKEEQFFNSWEIGACNHDNLLLCSSFLML